VRLLALGQLALRISQSMDLLAVKSLLRSPVAAGHYAGAQNISIAAMGLFAPAAGVVLQALSSARREGDAARLQATASRFVRTALAYAALLCALSVAAPRITSFLLGPDFAPSAQILALLLWAVAFRILAATGRVLISAVNESTSILLPLLALILIGLAAYALIVPAAGLSGAAWVATGLAAAAGATSLREGLRLTGIAFPWLSALRIFTSALASAAVASVDLGGGVLVLPVLAAATATFLALLALLGEWGHPRRWLAIPWRSGSP
jgi:O-antigen/teichoic acid export membrane protein